MVELLSSAYQMYSDKGFRHLSLYSLDRIHRALGRFRPYWLIAPRVYNIARRDVHKYTDSIDPFSTHYVSPDEIVHMSKLDIGKSVTFDRIQNVGCVLDGDWDVDCPRFEDTEIFSAMYERYVGGASWEDIKHVNDLLTKIKNGNRVWHGCTDPEDVFNRCKKIDSLYDDIRNNGYQSQLEIARSCSTSYPRAVTNEVLIDIGRDGNPLFVNGRHRLSIAKILKLDRIPVTIRVRHKQWMESQYSQDTSNNPDMWDE